MSSVELQLDGVPASVSVAGMVIGRGWLAAGIARKCGEQQQVPGPTTVHRMVSIDDDRTNGDRASHRPSYRATGDPRDHPRRP